MGNDDIYKAAAKLFNPDILLDSLFPVTHTNIHAVRTITDIYTDTNLKEWTASQCYTDGGRMQLWRTISSPIYDIPSLKARQKDIISMGPARKHIEKCLRDVTSIEKDILWILHTLDIKSAWPATLLFPSTPLLRYINYNRYLLNSYHIYKCVLMPGMNFVSPILTVLGPWLYLNRKMGLPFTLTMYIKILYTTMIEVLKSSNNVWTLVMRLLTVVTYVFFYFYNMIQSVQYTMMLHNIRKALLQKAESLSKFVATFSRLQKLCSGQLSAFQYSSVPPSVTSVYVYIVDPRRRADLHAMMDQVHKLDANFVATKMLYSKSGYTACAYQDTGDTKFYNMRHIALPSKQVANPCDLSANLIITGPNAAGKTTYTKTLCINIILSQTLGIARALRAHVTPVHAMGSFMRVVDVVGEQSLFEAEMHRASFIIKEAVKVSELGKRAIYFLDEPMHSTPPLEGTAASFAILEYLGKLPGVRVIITTHYHHLSLLEDANPDLFKNISMEAQVVEAGFRFPYKILRGPSEQSIALELLKNHDLSDVIVRAIEIKNKLCMQGIYGRQP